MIPLAIPLAFFWGLAEATVFFIVPDVLLSYYAVNNLLRALILAAVATVGAVCGGVVLFHFAPAHYEQFQSFFVEIPGISTDMLLRVKAQTSVDGLNAVFWGPLQGIPYKLFAVEASAQDLPLSVFVPVSVAARYLRFVTVSIMSGYGVRRLLNGHSSSTKYAALSMCWLVFYACYFSSI
jgi:membrane protein YqaA with SNARE-associated domain